jgi:micrococcal nuclease
VSARRVQYKRGLWFLLLAFSLVALAQARSPSAGETWGVVKRVIDGDSVVMQSGGQVRYIGIDTPEMSHRVKGVEPYAREAKTFNRKLVQGKRVRLELDVEHRDKYKRLLAYVYLEDGTFVNAELVRLGFARILSIPPNARYADLFLSYQQEAQENNRGLWGLE